MIPGRRSRDSGSHPGPLPGALSPSPLRAPGPPQQPGRGLGCPLGPKELGQSWEQQREGDAGVREPLGEEKGADRRVGVRESGWAQQPRVQRWSPRGRGSLRPSSGLCAGEWPLRAGSRAQSDHKGLNA